MLIRYIGRNYSTGSKYRKLVKQLDDAVSRNTPHQFQVVWNHPAGLKTVFFWAPIFKWGLVMAGISDMITRKGEEISLFQSGSLMISGAIWSRYSVVIIPVNYMLLSVNVFVALTQSVMFYRCVNYHMYVEPTLPEDRREHNYTHFNNKKEDNTDKK